MANAIALNSAMFNSQDRRPAVAYFAIAAVTWSPPDQRCLLRAAGWAKLMRRANCAWKIRAPKARGQFRETFGPVCGRVPISLTLVLVSLSWPRSA
jgi:hypothetical protein